MASNSQDTNTASKWSQDLTPQTNSKKSTKSLSSVDARKNPNKARNKPVHKLSLKNKDDLKRKDTKKKLLEMINNLEKSFINILNQIDLYCKRDKSEDALDFLKIYSVELKIVREAQPKFQKGFAISKTSKKKLEQNKTSKKEFERKKSSENELKDDKSSKEEFNQEKSKSLSNINLDSLMEFRLRTQKKLKKAQSHETGLHQSHATNLKTSFDPLTISFRKAAKKSRKGLKPVKSLEKELNDSLTNSSKASIHNKSSTNNSFCSFKSSSPMGLKPVKSQEKRLKLFKSRKKGLKSAKFLDYELKPVTSTNSSKTSLEASHSKSFTKKNFYGLNAARKSRMELKPAKSLDKELESVKSSENKLQQVDSTNSSRVSLPVKVSNEKSFCDLNTARRSSMGLESVKSSEKELKKNDTSTDSSKENDKVLEKNQKKLKQLETDSKEKQLKKDKTSANSSKDSLNENTKRFKLTIFLKRKDQYSN